MISDEMNEEVPTNANFYLNIIWLALLRLHDASAPKK